MYRFIIILFVSLSLASCKTNKMDKDSSSGPSAEKIILEAIQAHGGDKYKTANYSFTFRKKQYTFQNTGVNYKYSVTSERDGKVTKDVMFNEGMTRHIDDVSIPLSKTEQSRYSQGVNSVIYFATLPHKLKDKSVNKKYIGETTIKNKDYHIIEVSFDEEGGGKDHDDQYHYWVNKDTKLIDYFAYNYTVNNGGVRFRSAYNSRNVDGIIFQDYINFKAPVGTPLINLPGLYEMDKLTQLSLIETADIQKI